MVTEVVTDGAAAGPIHMGRTGGGARPASARSQDTRDTDAMVAPSPVTGSTPAAFSRGATTEEESPTVPSIFVSLAAAEAPAISSAKADPDAQSLSPASRDRSFASLLVALEKTVERNPVLAESLANMRGSPTRRGWRKRSRRAFYVVVVCALLAVGCAADQP